MPAGTALSREVALATEGAEQGDRDAAKTPAKGVAADEIDLEAVGEDELVGRVVDSSGEPIEGVEIDAWTWYPGNETRTDKQGRFRLKGLGRRQFIEVQFTKPEFSPRLFVRRQTGERDWEVTMTNTTLFEGQVKGPNGKPVAGALIRANRGPKRMEGGVINDIWTEARSGANGHYRLYVEADNYDIQIRMPGAGVARLKASLADDEAKDLDITLAPGVAFRAKVVDNVTGKPVTGVRFWHWQHRGIEGRSNAEGALVINDMFPGRFAFNVEAAGFARWWSEEAASEWNRPYRENENRNWQRNFDDLDFDVQPDLGVVTISVEKEVTIRGRVVDPEGKPVAGATVAPALTGSGNSLTGDTRFSVVTGKDGRYEMHLPASGNREYNLMAHDGKYQQWRNWANGVTETLETKPGESVADLDIQLTRPAIVRGRVVDAQGQPVARRQVRAAAADLRENRYYDATTETDEQGKFELKFIRPGEQYIQAAPFWLNPEQAPSKSTHYVELTAGQVEKDVELVAQPDR
jgi:protocatechuate 3,4-dioxygenase beta subunit